MTESEMPHARLFAAVVALQAHLPRVGKGETAKVPGKDGKQGYTYKYADLADISQAILPLLAKHGLAFIAKPTMADGEFGLDYKLIHSSGESDGGFYRLPDPRNTSPQQVGSAITYARRYCLCAVTGIAPDGDDDDAGAAQQGHWQSAGDAFANASPMRPSPPKRQMPPAGQNARPLSPEDPWAAKVDGVTSTDDAADVEAELKQLFEDGGISAGHAGQVKAALEAKVAANRIPPNQRPRSSQPQENGDGSDEAGFAQDFMARLAKADADRDFVGMRTELARAVASKKIAPETANELIEKLNERKAKATAGAAP